MKINYKLIRFFVCCLIIFIATIQADRIENENNYDDLSSSDLTTSQQFPPHRCPPRINCRDCQGYCRTCPACKRQCSCRQH